jgi:hypothetical protein
MKKYFYQHLIDHEDLNQHLDKVGLPKEEKLHLIEIFEKTTHLEVIGFVLSQLPEEHHEALLKNFEERPHDEGLMVFLKRSIDGFDEHLNRIIKEVKQDFLREVEDYEFTTKEWLEGV